MFLVINIFSITIYHISFARMKSLFFASKYITHIMMQPVDVTQFCLWKYLIFESSNKETVDVQKFDKEIDEVVEHQPQVYYRQIILGEKIYILKVLLTRILKLSFLSYFLFTRYQDGIFAIPFVALEPRLLATAAAEAYKGFSDEFVRLSYRFSWYYVLQ